MKFSDYEAAWKRQPLPRGADAELSDLKRTYEAQRRKAAAAFLVRDWSELVACGIMVVVYAEYWRSVGPSGWPMGFAIGMILFVAGMFIRVRLRSRRHRVAADAPLLTKISADLEELRYQRTLLRGVWRWYLAPCAIAMLLHASVILGRVPEWDPLRQPASLVTIMLFIGLVCWFAWVINRRAVRLRIEPRIAELEKLQRDQTAAE